MRQGEWARLWWRVKMLWRVWHAKPMPCCEDCTMPLLASDRSRRWCNDCYDTHAIEAAVDEAIRNPLAKVTADLPPGMDEFTALMQSATLYHGHGPGARRARHRPIS